MNIIDRLKKGKKSESVLDSLIKKKDTKERADIIQERQDDIEVRELQSSDIPTPAEDDDDVVDIAQIEEKTAREFRTEGMTEFDIESLGGDTHAGVKAGYKARINSLIDDNKIDEAINLLRELKTKLTEKK